MRSSSVLFCIAVVIALLPHLSLGQETSRTDQALSRSVVVDVGSDLVRLGLAQANIPRQGTADDTPKLQAAVDYVAAKGGGTVFVPPGLYRIGGLNVKPRVEIVGAGVDRTVFRAVSGTEMFRMEGGALRNFTAYGTVRTVVWSPGAGNRPWRPDPNGQTAPYLWTFPKHNVTVPSGRAAVQWLAMGPRGADDGWPM